MKLIKLYQQFYTPHGLNNKYKKVDEYLLRGPHPQIGDLIELKNAGVTQIYDFRHRGIRGFKFVEKYFCNELGIKYIRYPYSYLNKEYPSLKDFTNVAKSVKETGEQGGKTLFHCNSGSHRTAHMSAFYEVTKGEEIDDVFNRLGVIKYAQNVQDAINKHFYQQKYFNRKEKAENTYNPISYFKNKFNNRVIKATQLAHSSFLAIMTRFKQW